MVAKTFPDGHLLREENYWIRTIPAENCYKFSLGNIPDERQGILRYDSNSDVVPTTARANFSTVCHDEPYQNLIPILEWTVGEAANNIFEDSTEVSRVKPPFGNDTPYLYGLFTRWAIGNEPLWLNFSDPTLLQIHKQPENWSPRQVVVPENFGDDDWVYLLITGNYTFVPDPRRDFPVAAHPVGVKCPLLHALAQLSNRSDSLAWSRFRSLAAI